jgi:hypothetical protein
MTKDRPNLSSERVLDQDRTSTVKQLGLDTKMYLLTYWLTDHQSQCDSDYLGGSANQSGLLSATSSLTEY